MPRILVIMILHLLIFGLGGLMFDAMAVGAGYADAATEQQVYAWLAQLWHIFNAPAGYLFYSLADYRWVWILIQLVTSFVWANIYALLWSLWKNRTKAE